MLAASPRRCLLFLLLFAYPIGATAATFTVSNSSDSGAGSLRQAMLDSNSAGGSNTIQWSGVGGLISASSPLPTLTSAVTFDVSAATANPIVAGDINIGPGLTINGPMTLAGTLSGTGALSKTGTAALTLIGTNTYTGGTSITGGSDATINFSRDNNLGDAATTITVGGSAGLWMQGDVTSSRPINFTTGAHDLYTNGFVASFSGPISGAEFFTRGGGTATFSGTISVSVGLGPIDGTMILSGNNSFGTFVSISAGAVLAVSQDSNLGNTFIENQGGTFRVLASTTISKDYTPGFLGQIGVFDTNGFDTKYTGHLSSTFTFIKEGSGVLTMGGDNGSFIGGFQIKKGYVTATSTSAFGSGPLVLNGGGISLSSAVLTAASVSGNGTLSVLVSSSNSFGQLTTGGAINVSGMTLQISLGSYMPPIGSTFTVVRSTGLTGQFSSVTNPSGRYFAVSYSSSDISIVASVDPSSSVVVGASGGTVSLSAPPGTITLQVPASAFSASQQVALSVPGSFPAAVSNAGTLQGTSVGVQIDLGANLEPTSPVLLSIAYRASDATGLNPSRFVIARYDATQNTWVPLSSSVDALNRVVTAYTSHLSLFQIMQNTPSSQISTVKAFPNPMRTVLGQRTMTFSQIPANARLRIYSLSGLLIKDLTSDASGLAQWDGTNRSGRDVASGVYYALVQGVGGSKTIEIAVQR